MQDSFWHNKWETNQIGFHLDEANPRLTNNIDKLGLDQGSKIFLPLCGKTVDIAYLLKLGYSIVGIELSEIAIKQLFQDLDLTPKTTNVDEFKLYQADGIDVFVGDFFNLNSSVLSKTEIDKIDATYDRAAFIALPFEIRQRYSKHLVEITDSAPQLLVTFQYDKSKNNGPPFSIDDSEIVEQYAHTYPLIKCIEEEHITDDMKGRAGAIEKVWTLRS